jgi:hydroxymethylbilane synthase
MSGKLRIGTRESALAIWQAKFVQSSLAELGIPSELIFIKSAGELDLKSPLYEMGVQGIFTKALDLALLNHQIDVAVHSLKDVPTQLPRGLTLAAVPKRGNPLDVLVYKEKLPDETSDYVVATSSLRRSAQWLHRYPIHQSAVLRGNINSRLEKLMTSKNWNGALFAAAGIERINLEVPHRINLDWMIPAPAQGALGIVVRESDQTILQSCHVLNDKNSFRATDFERQFLRKLMGGCSMPIGGYANITNDQLHFKGCVLTLDGRLRSDVEIVGSIDRREKLIEEAVDNLLHHGGDRIMSTFKN